MKKIIILISLFAAVNINAQYPLAPEKWSIPKEVAIISEYTGRAESPSISFDGNKLYFHGISMTERADTGWQWPVRLNNNVNQNLVRYPSISPNGKRLFFTWFLGGWDLYYSDWDSVANDWGVAVNCGPNVNTPAYAEGGSVLPNDTTLIFLRTTVANISYWNSQTQTWGPAERWPTPTLWFASDWGIYVSPTYNKVYLAGQRSDTTINGDPYLNYDIIVSYRDTTNPMGYKPPYILNFSLYADTQYLAGNYEDRFEGFPTLTPDGKKMYFTATYHGQTTIYESTMLIDENGDPVSVEDESNLNHPQDFNLFQNYPNPFNPSTTIEYSIPEASFVELKVYDILGGEVATLVKENKPSGKHSVKFNASNLPSGIYFYRIVSGNFTATKKLILLK